VTTGYLNVVGFAPALEWLAHLPDCSVDSVVSDPPYGLGEQPPPLEVLGAWLRSRDYVPKGAGFMGREWDAFVPQPSLWREVFRVLKPGGYLLAFFGSRTLDWGSLAIRVAGFEIVDSLSWIYGSGMPKSHDLSKAIDAAASTGKSNSVALKHANDNVRTGDGRVRASTQNNGIITGHSEGPGGPRSIRDEPATEEGKRWRGYGTALKPCFEPIVLARKPLIGTYVENVLTHGVGALNIDACRISCEGGSPSQNRRESAAKAGAVPNSQARAGKILDNRSSLEIYTQNRASEQLGRWPSNLLLTHSPACRLIGSKEIKSNSHHPASRGKGGISTTGHSGQADLVERRPGAEIVENWACADDCPVRGIDEQSGFSKSPPAGNTCNAATKSMFSAKTGDVQKLNGYGDSGGASRYFAVFGQQRPVDEVRYFYSAKAATNERWFFCRACNVVFRKSDDAERGSHDEHASEVVGHPTQKPIDLMEWLVRLVTPTGGVVLDPFCGTGTTAVAAKRQGFNFVTCDIGEDYVKIAEARLASVEMTEATRTTAGYFCPGCKAKGQIKLIARAVVDTAKTAGRKVSCMKCMGRFEPAELGAT